jgi:hypothetical protein
MRRRQSVRFGALAGVRGAALAGVAAAFLAGPLGTVSALADACVSGSVASYIALGATGCSVGGLTFSNIHVNSTVSNGGSVTLGNFTPVSPLAGEFGLLLNYTALATGANSTADVTWSYNVSVATGGINDAFLAMAGDTTGSGQAQVSEILSNGITLSLFAPGSATATFPATPSLFVMKDQADFVGAAGGTSTTSALTNAFSTVGVAPVPSPIAGAGLPGLMMSMGALWALNRRRRKAPAV